jgi:hypothetical protein
MVCVKSGVVTVQKFKVNVETVNKLNVGRF